MGPAYSIDLEVDRHLDAFGNLDKWNAADHPAVVPIKGHCAFYLAVACSLAGKV